MENCKICGKKDWNESETRCNSCGHELIESGSVIKIDPADLPPWHWRDVAHNFKQRAEKAEAENARLRDYIVTVAKFAVDLGYQSGHEHTVDGHYAPPSQYDYDIFDGIDLMEVGS